MAEYQVKKLYNISTKTGPASETYESLWAYYIRYPQTETSLPGRFRIRITRMTAAEFMAMMGMEEELDSEEGYSIQGYVEKWSDKGWLQCIDWIGDPESSNDKIEKDLLEMFRAFTTGESIKLVQDNFTPPRPPTPKKPNGKKTGMSTVINFPSKSDSENPGDNKDTKDSSFDWI